MPNPYYLHCIGALLMLVMVVDLSLADVPPAATTSAQSAGLAHNPAVEQQVVALSVEAQGKWNGTIYPDGHGDVRYGSPFGDAVSFPIGTFDFAKLLAQLEPSLSNQRLNDQKDFEVLLYRGDRSCDRRYVTNVVPIATLFEVMRDACEEGRGQLGVEGFRRAWQKDPPTTLNSRSGPTTRPRAMQPAAAEQFVDDASIVAISREDQTSALKARLLKKEFTLSEAISVLTTYKKVTRDQYIVYVHQPGARGLVTIRDGTVFAWEIEPTYAATLKSPATGTIYLLRPDIAEGKKN